jgi:hypothetical protein
MSKETVNSGSNENDGDGTAPVRTHRLAKGIVAATLTGGY